MVLSFPGAERAPRQTDPIVVRGLTIADAEEAAEVIRSRLRRARADATTSAVLGPAGGGRCRSRPGSPAGGGFGADAGWAELVAVALWQAVDGDALLVGRVCALHRVRAGGP